MRNARTYIHLRVYLYLKLLTKLCFLFLVVFCLQKETPSDVLLHLAALRGDDITLRRVLDSGKVHVDCKDEVKCTIAN